MQSDLEKAAEAYRQAKDVSDAAYHKFQEAAEARTQAHRAASEANEMAARAAQVLGMVALGGITYDEAFAKLAAEGSVLMEKAEAHDPS